MGWMYTNKPKGQSTHGFFREAWNSAHNEVLDVGQVGWREAYAAVQASDAEKADYIIGVAILIHYCSNSYYNFGYKDMTETMGPGISQCPERILRQLTPIRELELRKVYEGSSLEWAREWRRRCWRNLVLRKRKVPFGAWIKLPDPVALGYGSEKTCYLQRERYHRERNIFRSREGNLIRIRDWRTRRFKVVSEEEVLASGGCGR